MVFDIETYINNLSNEENYIHLPKIKIIHLPDLIRFTNLKIFNKHNFVSITVVLVFLSMSGIPPLAGFIGKFLLFNFLFLTQKYIFVIIFSLLNFFSIYFYIQNLRYLVSKTQQHNFLIGGFYVFFNKKLLNIIVLFNLANFFGILYFEDILYIFINIVSYKNL
jgi:NADH-quinone oxidoreductase subunit N